MVFIHSISMLKNGKFLFVSLMVTDYLRVPQVAQNTEMDDTCRVIFRPRSSVDDYIYERFRILSHIYNILYLNVNIQCLRLHGIEVKKKI